MDVVLHFVSFHHAPASDEFFFIFLCYLTNKVIRLLAEKAQKPKMEKCWQQAQLTVSSDAVHAKQNCLVWRKNMPTDILIFFGGRRGGEWFSISHDKFRLQR